MVVELRAKSQVTIPSKVVKDLGFEEGDKFEVVEKDGGVFLFPVVTYPKAYIEKLEDEFKRSSEEVKAGKRPVFNSAEEMAAYLETVNEV